MNELEVCQHCSHIHNLAATCYPQNEKELDVYDPDYTEVAKDKIDDYIENEEA